MDNPTLHEDNFISKLLPQLSKKNLLPGNDDAIAFETPENEKNSLLIVNTDSISWSTDALPPSMSLYEFGMKLVTATVSDIIAKGATPYFFLSSLIFPKDFSSSEASEVAKGMVDGCKIYGLEYMGGDIGSSHELIINGIVIGYCKPEHLLKRSTVNSGDYICVTDNFGYTGLGYLYYLNKNPKTIPNPILINVNKKLLRPKARLDWLPYLIKYANATIDSSDGLGKSLYHLANESNVQILINKLPFFKGLDDIVKIGSEDFQKAILYAGEEFEIIFSISKEKYTLLKEELANKNEIQPIIIGKALSGEKKVFYNNKELNLKESWDSAKGFSKEQ